MNKYFIVICLLLVGCSSDGVGYNWDKDMSCGSVGDVPQGSWYNNPINPIQTDGNLGNQHTSVQWSCSFY